eukprot:gene16375-52184_t
MERFVGDDRFHDVVFRFAEGTDAVYAHKIILAARSPVMQQARTRLGWAGMEEVCLDEGVEPAVRGVAGATPPL